MPFLGLLLYYFHDEHKLGLVRHATSELYRNLSYATLSGERPLEFQAISDFIGELSFSIKSFTVKKNRQKEIEMKKIAKTINDERIFNSVINDPLDDVVEIMNLPYPEHKKTTFPYVEPTVQLPDKIEETQKAIDDDYAGLLNKIYGVNDVALAQKEQEKTRQVIEDVLEPSPFETQDDFWWEDEVFPKDDTKETIDTSKMIVGDIKNTHNVDIQALSDNILKNSRPRDNRTIQELIDDDFIPLDNRTWQERMDYENISLQSENDAVTIEDVPDDEYTFNIRRPSTKPIPVLKIPNPEPNIVTVEPPIKVTNIPLTAPPKTLDVDIRALSDNILKNLKSPQQQQQQPRDNRNLQDLIDDEFIPLDDRDPAEIVKDKNEPENRPFPIITLTTPDDPVIQIDATDAWDDKKTQIQTPGPIYKLSTDYEKKVRAANKIKNKYLRKKVGQRKHINKISAEWLKTAGYLDTSDQDKINYIFAPPKKKTENTIPGNAGHFIRTEIENTDFKNENLVTKKTRNKKDRTPYSNKNNKNNNSNDTSKTLKLLDDIAVMEPGKSAQIAAKKIQKKYKKIKESINNKRQQKSSDKRTRKNTISEPPAVAPQLSSKVSTIRTANKIKGKYLKIRTNKNSQKITDQHKKDKLLRTISAIENVKDTSDKKRKNLAAQKIKKYKNLKKPKRTYLVSEKDIEKIDYNSTDEEDIYAGESIVNAANKVFDYNKFKEEGSFAGKSILNKANKVFNFEQFKRQQARKIQEYNDELLNETAETINYVDDLNINDVKGNKDLLIAAKKIKENYKKMRRRQQQKINDAETMNYVDDLNFNDVQENKNLLIAAKKIKSKYKKIRREQRKKLEDTETINYANDINVSDLAENKNLKIAAKKMQEKYKKIRQKRKAPVPIETLQRQSEIFISSDKKSKRKTDRSAIIAAKKILKKYKYGRF